MTDPFKKQRFSPTIPKSSSSSQLLNPLSPIQETTFNKYTGDIFNPESMPIDASQSIAYNRNPKYEIDTTGITNENIALSSTDQAHFIRAHMESNKELIAQLKSNIELLFKASK